MVTDTVKLFKEINQEGYTMKNKKWFYRLSSLAMTGMAAFALMVTSSVSNAACLWYFGQDEMPKNSKKFRKF